MPPPDARPWPGRFRGSGAVRTLAGPPACARSRPLRPAGPRRAPGRPGPRPLSLGGWREVRRASTNRAPAPRAARGAGRTAGWDKLRQPSSQGSPSPPEPGWRKRPAGYPGNARTSSWKRTDPPAPRARGSGIRPEPGLEAQLPAPWHFLYFFPDPQGQGSLRPTSGTPPGIAARAGAPASRTSERGRGVGGGARSGAAPGIRSFDPDASGAGVGRRGGWADGRGGSAETWILRNRSVKVDWISRMRSSNISYASRLYSTSGSRCPYARY